MNPYLNIAIRAARTAGRIILRNLPRLERIKVERKGHNDFVTAVDQESEAAIMETISGAYPEHAFLAEESGASGDADAEWRWVIDPLDGTTNYIHGYPQFAVSIALQRRGEAVAGVVFDPLRDEIFTAARGEGAYRNERRLRVSRARGLESALIATGFPHGAAEHTEQFLSILRTLLPMCHSLRRAGAAALDLAHVASGQLDGFWEMGLRPWDMAAGALLVQEAGGRVADLSGGVDFINAGNIICGTPDVFQQLLAVIQHERGG